MSRIPEDISLIELISLLPGIRDVQNDMSYKDNTYTLYFNVRDTDEGLFILTRCIDRRYFYFGENCNIRLAVGDTMKYENSRPITYILTLCGDLPPLPSKYTADRIEKELVVNILHHLNHYNFKEYFKIDSEIIFDNYLALERIKKINLIKLRRSMEQAKDFSIFNKIILKNKE